MNNVLILTISGADRPGLVEELSSVVAEHGGNWEHCRMAHLNGHFVGLLQVRVSDDAQDTLEKALHALPGLELTAAGGRSDAQEPERIFHLELVGGDHPGIVRAISAQLATAGINIEELGTDTVSSPESGEPLFKARARLGVPNGVDIHSVLGKVEAVAHDILVDVRLTD